MTVQMQASMIRDHALVFTAETAEGFEFKLEGELTELEARQAATPMQMILIGVAGCAAMDVLSILEKKRQVVNRFVVQVSGERTENHPRVFSSIRLMYNIVGKNVDPKATKRAIELSHLRYCPGIAIVGELADVKQRYQIYAEDGSLVVDSDWYVPAEDPDP